MSKHCFSPGATAKISLGILLATSLLSCGGGQQGPPQSPPVNADFKEVKPVTTQLEKKYPGAIEGSVNVDIKAQVSGYLEAIYVKEGDYVQKGQSLFKIKGDVFAEQVANSDAALKAAESSVENTRIEVEKIRPLVEGNVVSDVQLKTAEANYAAAKAQAAQARAALGSAKINAGFSLIKAPVSGYIGRIPNRIGNLVTPADAVALTTLSDINTVFVYFSLSEADFISFVKDRKADKGLTTVDLIMADGAVYDHKGTLEIASGNIDRATGSISLKAVFPNPDKMLRSGGSAKVVLHKTLNNAITVPMASVKDIQDRYFVFTLADSNKVKMKPIHISGHAGNDYVVKDGITAGEKIATDRIDVLTEGTQVIPAVAK